MPTAKNKAKSDVETSSTIYHNPHFRWKLRPTMRGEQRFRSRTFWFSAQLSSLLFWSLAVAFSIHPSRSSSSLIADAFVLVPSVSRDMIRLPRRFVSTQDSVETGGMNANEDMDDEELLRQVPTSQLADLCERYELSTKGTKASMLKRLREFATQQAALEHQRRLERRTRVENGDQDSKERYEIVSDDPEGDEDEEDEGFFFFQDPSTAATEKKIKPKTPPPVPNNVITAPPPPPMEPNENGERVVTVYSTKDQNDLTGVAAAQPGQSNAMMAGSDTSSSEPWDMQDAPAKAAATSKELEEAKEAVSELVHVLLTMTGAPAFREEFSEGLTPVPKDGRVPIPDSSPEGFVGFDPSKVPTDILVSSSQSLRAGRGQVLQEVLRDFELRAIGHDGMSGDNIEKGGGHYREVTKVRAFLEGYRRAEVRRVARETTTVLLDKLVTEGIDGLDFLLSSMSKASDDTGDVGDLSDSLVEFLNDAIRQQEKKVDKLVASRMKEEPSEIQIVEEDPTASLWNSTIEEGQQVEMLDPKDPKVQQVLKKEYEKLDSAALEHQRTPTPQTAPEQLLLLLTLLRERIKAEAAFSNDEKGRNLRLLAYCLNVGSAKEREELVLKQIGQSIDRLDSFLELIVSSIEYAESTTHQLQPSKSRPLNISLLKSIETMVSEMREKQAWKASGIPPQ